MLAHAGDKYCEDRQDDVNFSYNIMLHHAWVIYYHIHAKTTSKCTHTFSGKCEIEVLMAAAALVMPNLASDL